MLNGPLPPGFRRILRRELRQIAARPAFIFMLLPFPLILFITLAMVFHAGLPTGLPVAVVDLDGTMMSHQVIRMVDATPDVDVKLHLASLSEAKRALVSRKAYAVLYIPKNMERDLQLGHRPNLVMFINNQLYTTGSITHRAIASALSTFNVGVSIQTRMARGADRDSATAAAQPIPLQINPLFNPTLNYIQFLLAAIMPAILQIFVSVSAALSFSRDHHTAAGMPRAMRLGGSAFRVIAGKLLPYTIIWSMMLMLTDAIIFGGFDGSFHGNIAFHFVYGAIFILASQFLGACGALLSRDTAATLGFVGVLTAPAFGFAGVSYPRIMMNQFARWWGDMIPLTSYLELRTDQVLRGTPIHYSLPEFYWALATMVGWLLLLVVLVQADAYKKSKKIAQAQGEMA